MSLIKKLWEAEENKNLEQFNEVMHEDFVWVKHSTGEEIGRDVLSTWFMSEDAPKTEKQRIIYGIVWFLISICVGFFFHVLELKVYLILIP